MKEISSSDNSLFKTYVKLLKSSGIKKEGLFLAHGDKIVQDYLTHHADKIEAVLSTPKIGFPSQLTNKHISLAPNLFQELDIFETRSPIAVLKSWEFQSWEITQAPQGLELLLPTQDPSNLGAIVRSAFAFGIKNIVLLKEAAHPLHPKAIRASSGYALNMNFKVGPSVKELAALKNLIALDMNGTDIGTFEWPKNCYLLVGEEGPGIPKDLVTQKIKIPTHDQCESLNAMVAASIALYKYSSQFSS